MSIYSKWILTKKLSQVVWVYGIESVLIEDTLNTIKQLLNSTQFNTKYFYASMDNESEIWEYSRQRPISDSDNSLIIIKDSEKLVNWQYLEDWLNNRKTLPNTTLIFVSSEDPPIPDLRAPKATLIKCTSLKSEELINWIVSKSGLSTESASNVLYVTSGNMLDILNICLKVKSIFPETDNNHISEKALRALGGDLVSDFVRALINLDNSLAIKCISALTSDNRYKILGILDSRLSQLLKLQEALSRNASSRSLATIPGVPYYLVKELLPIVKYYSPKRLASCRRQLALIDSYQQRGIDSALLETLVASW